MCVCVCVAIEWKWPVNFGAFLLLYFFGVNVLFGLFFLAFLELANCISACDKLTDL